jgi:hypothetical protein
LTHSREERLDVGAGNSLQPRNPKRIQYGFRSSTVAVAPKRVRKSRPLSPHDRFVMAPEKMVRKAVPPPKVGHLSGGLLAKDAKSRPFSANSGEIHADFNF